MEQPQALHPNRETYLLAAVELLKPMFDSAGSPLPPVHVSTGWPSSRGTSKKIKALGECWNKSASADEVAQIFISPFLDHPLHNDIPANDGYGVLPVLVHELVHAAVGNKAGHGKPFRRLAETLGLEGKMTSTFAGKTLLEKLNGYLPVLGAYPHAKIDPTLSGKKKQGTRMHKCECLTCGFVVRITRKWLNEVGAPHCPKHGAMHHDEIEETEEESD